VRPERCTDQPNRDPGAGSRRVRPSNDRRDPVFERQPARDVEEGTPPDLEVSDAVGGLVIDELRGDPFEGFRRPA